MKKDRPDAGDTDMATGVDSGAARRDHKQSQAAQLSAANVEESPHMDRGDSALGTGESVSHGTEADAPAADRRAAEDKAGSPGESLPQAALDSQYGTKSTMKTGPEAVGASRAGTGTTRGAETANRTGKARADTSKGADRGRSADTGKGGDRVPPAAPDPGSSEQSSGTERDTMTGPRPGGGS